MLAPIWMFNQYWYWINQYGHWLKIIQYAAYWIQFDQPVYIVVAQQQPVS